MGVENGLGVEGFAGCSESAGPGCEVAESASGPFTTAGVAARADLKRDASFGGLGVAAWTGAARSTISLTGAVPGVFFTAGVAAPDVLGVGEISRSSENLTDFVADGSVSSSMTSPGDAKMFFGAAVSSWPLIVTR